MPVLICRRGSFVRAGVQLHRCARDECASGVSDDAFHSDALGGEMPQRHDYEKEKEKEMNPFTSPHCQNQTLVTLAEGASEARTVRLENVQLLAGNVAQDGTGDSSVVAARLVGMISVS
jgi:hypothetical protein